MTLNDIVGRSDTMVAVEPRHWAWAHFLGVARTASNDDRRARRSDRGRFNRQVDLLGALGELFLLRTALMAERSAETVAYMRSHLYDEQGGAGVRGPDIRFVEHVTHDTHELDVKTFDCSENKTNFAINDNKHRMLDGQCTAYVCVVAPPYGRRMAVSRLVPYETVDDWPVGRLRRCGSPSRNCPIQEFLNAHFTAPLNLNALRRDVFPMKEIDRARGDGAVRAEFEELVPGVPII